MDNKFNIGDEVKIISISSNFYNQIGKIITKEIGKYWQVEIISGVGIYFGENELLNITQNSNFKKEIIGYKLAEILNLREDRGYSPKRYKTSRGNKTALGIYELMKEILTEGGKNV